MNLTHLGQWRHGKTHRSNLIQLQRSKIKSGPSKGQIQVELDLVPYISL